MVKSLSKDARTAGTQGSKQSISELQRLGTAGTKNSFFASITTLDHPNHPSARISRCWQMCIASLSMRCDHSNDETLTTAVLSQSCSDERQRDPADGLFFAMLLVARMELPCVQRFELVSFCIFDRVQIRRHFAKPSNRLSCFVSRQTGCRGRDGSELRAHAAKMLIAHIAASTQHHFVLSCSFASTTTTGLLRKRYGATLGCQTMIPTNQACFVDLFKTAKRVRCRY